MTVIVLGGHDRLEAQLQSYAKDRGINLKFINKPKPKRNMKEALSKADFVLVVTKLVAHEMVALAKRCAQGKCRFCAKVGVCEIKREIDTVLAKKFSP
ncbi:MAG: DUF2325 domain-containing protein [Caldimicrobium sp.]|nr:DUF2325 domain-containing protein [Caldimicrobium sp.]